MTAVDDLIANLRRQRASNFDEPIILNVDTFISALLEIEGGLVPGGNENPNLVYAGPASLPAAPPAFRALIGADLPTPGASSLGGVQALTGAAHQFLTGLSTGGVLSAAQPATGDLSDITAGTWTPIDASGAGLVFTSVQGNYIQTGNLIYVAGIVTYPSTANGANAAIGGLPFTVSSTGGQNTQGLYQSSSQNAGGTILTLSRSTTSFVYRSGTNGAISNATLSGSFKSFAGTYQTGP